MNARFARAYADGVQWLRGWSYHAALAEMEVAEWLPHSELHRRQRHKLGLLLEHCRRHVPFYRVELARRGITRTRLAEMAAAGDLEALPIVDKSELRRGYARFWATDEARPVELWKTSGSSGQPFSFRLERSAVATNVFAALARGRRWWGIEAGAPELMIWSSVRDISGTTGGRLRALRRRLSWGLKNIRLVDTYNLDREQVRHAYGDLLRFQPVCTRSISSGLFRFCALLRELGLDGRALGIRHAIYTGETLLTHQKQLVEEVLGCKTICEYGCSELGIIAFECPAGGLHLFADNLFFELRKGERAARPHEDAELVVTRLNDYAAPLVRYAVGDVVAPGAGPCSCGRSLPLIGGVRGRTHAQIATPQGGVVHGLFFTHLFDDIPEVQQFRIVQPGLDSLRIEVISGEAIGGSIRDRIQRTVGDAMGDGVTIDVVQVETLPVSRSGKTQWIVSHVASASSTVGEVNSPGRD